VSAQLADLALELAPGAASEITLAVRGLPMVYDVRKKELRCLDRAAPLPLDRGRLRLRVLVDSFIAEIYANDGRVYMPMKVPFDLGNREAPLDLENRRFSLSAKGEGARLLSVKVSELESIWKKQAPCGKTDSRTTR